MLNLKCKKILYVFTRPIYRHNIQGISDMQAVGRPALPWFMREKSLLLASTLTLRQADPAVVYGKKEIHQCHKIVTFPALIRDAYCASYSLPMKTIILACSAAAFTGLMVQAAPFQSGHLAVLRAGDDQLDLKLKQSPAFVDEFIPGVFNPAPLSSVAIPTNGPNALFFNGHAATEGDLARSADHRLLTVAGYGGESLLQVKGTPSLLDIGRGFCTVDAAGAIHTTIYKLPLGDDKMNPRGVVTDGTNNFWGCGNAVATLYYDAASSSPVVFDSIPNSRAMRIINNTLYTTLNEADAVAGQISPGIFSFLDDSGNPAPMPRSAKTTLQPVVSVQEPYTKIAGFDMNADGTIAYVADTEAGIQKYVKTGGAWKFAYNFAIPQNIPGALNRGNGCFGLVVDFSGHNPIIYATTTEGYNGCVNSNRVVQIVDSGASAPVRTIAQAPSEKIAYRGIDFTPEMSAKP
jgi:hypothetical protein